MMVHILSSITAFSTVGPWTRLLQHSSMRTLAQCSSGARWSSVFAAPSQTMLRPARDGQMLMSVTRSSRAGIALPLLNFWPTHLMLLLAMAVASRRVTQRRWSVRVQLSRRSRGPFPRRWQPWCGATLLTSYARCSCTRATCTFSSVWNS